MAGTEQFGAPLMVAPGAHGENGGAAEDAKPPVFEPYVYEPPPVRTSRTFWAVLGLSILLGAGGLVYNATRPREAAARPKPLNVKEMTARQLAEDASALAAHELARRMTAGNPAERVDALQAVQLYSSPRLTQNMAMAMATQVSNRQAQVMAEVERRVRMSEEGHDPEPRSAR